MIKLAKIMVMSISVLESEHHSEIQKKIDQFVEKIEEVRSSIDACTMSEVEWKQSSGGEGRGRFTRITAIFTYA